MPPGCSRRGELVGIFPEGIRGAFTPYRTTYRLRDFSKSAFAEIAVENQAPVFPAAVIGHAEIFPILGRIDSSYVKREFGWPYLPIAPPVSPGAHPDSVQMARSGAGAGSGAGTEAGGRGEHRAHADFSRHVQDIVQRNIDDMVPGGRAFFGGSAGRHGPAVPRFEFRPT